MSREPTTGEKARLFSDIFERLTAAVQRSAPFESLDEARLHLQLGLNTLDQQAALPAADQDPELCRSLLVELAATCLKAVCDLYPSGRAEEEHTVGTEV